MILNDLDELAPVEERIVIINVGTELVSVLALASALRNGGGVPVLVVNCDPVPESTKLFEQLHGQWTFDLIAMPRQVHGVLLDHLFRTLPDERLLLLDSDAEIRDPHLLERWRESFASADVFGAGFTHGPFWLTAQHGAGERTGYYAERPWIPLTILRVAHVRDALAAGKSFAARTHFNDVSFAPRLGRLLSVRLQESFTPGNAKLARVRERAPWLGRLRNTRLPWMAWARAEFSGHRPNYVYCDTGADVFAYLRYERERWFAGSPVEVMGDPAHVIANDQLAHLHGVTRLGLGICDENGTEVASVAADVERRLRDVYGVDWPSLSAAAHGTAFGA